MVKKVLLLLALSFTLALAQATIYEYTSKEGTQYYTEGYPKGLSTDERGLFRKMPRSEVDTITPVTLSNREEIKAIMKGDLLPDVPPPVLECAEGYDGVFPDCTFVCTEEGTAVNDSNDGCVPVEPPMGNMVYVNTDLEPEGNPGFSELRITTSDASLYDKSGENAGDFRINCNRFSHMEQVDPIVNPGEMSMHHHTFFGNTSLNRNSDLMNLSNVGNSTCAGGIANRSAYWVPSMIDTSTGRPLAGEFSVYYKTQRSDLVVAPPKGLRMIARPVNTIPSSYMCNEVYPGTENEIVACGQGSTVRYGVEFPNCWDGVNLDSPDHMSHMAYAAWGAACPASHPVMIPNITLNAFYYVDTPAGTSNWALASDEVGGVPGSSIHADWVNGWQPEEIEHFIENCHRAEKDCHADLRGDGTTYY